MKQILVNQDIRPLSEFRSSAASLIKQVRETKRPLVITQRGRSVGVFLDVEVYEAMQKKIENCDQIQNRPGKAEPSRLIAGKGKISGDILSPVVSAEEWDALQ